MTVRPLGQFDFVNQFRMAFSKADPKGGSAQAPSP